MAFLLTTWWKVNYLQNGMKMLYFLIFLSNDYVYIFSLKLSNKNKQWLYKIQKCPTSLFYHALLIKQNEWTYYLTILQLATPDFQTLRHPYSEITEPTTSYNFRFISIICHCFSILIRVTEGGNKDKDQIDSDCIPWFISKLLAVF